VTWIITAGVLLPASPAFAHSLDAASRWDFDPWFVVPLCGTAALFLLGSMNLWRSAGLGRGVRWNHHCAFWAGWSLLFFAIASPLHWLADRLFSAHMIEHMVLMLVAPPLLACARPSGVMIWAFPRPWRGALGAIGASSSIAALWGVFGHPVAATAVQALALWSWHAPVLFDWALRSEAAHRLEHLCFFFSAVVFWWSLLHGRGPGRGERVRDGINIGCLFVTVLHSGLLGALLTLSIRIWYPEQAHVADGFGLSPLEDQQLAGIVMWVPMGVLYTGAALYFANRLISSALRRSAELASRNRARRTGIVSS